MKDKSNNESPDEAELRFLRELQLELAAKPAMTNEWCDRAAGALETLMAADPDVALLPTLLVAACEDMNTHKTERANLMLQQTAQSAELSRFSAKYSELTDK